MVRVMRVMVIAIGKRVHGECQGQSLMDTIPDQDRTTAKFIDGGSCSALLHIHLFGSENYHITIPTKHTHYLAIHSCTEA
jgi:hypothetical protein